MGSSKDGSRAYAVGYGKPPTETRFRKGQSGNPKGRTSGRKNLRNEFIEELGRKIAVTENGRQRLLPAQTVFTKRLIADALRGDPRAREQVLRLITQFEQSPDTTRGDPAESAKDAEILDRFRTDLLQEIEEKAK